MIMMKTIMTMKTGIVMMSGIISEKWNVKTKADQLLIEYKHNM